LDVPSDVTGTTPEGHVMSNKFAVRLKNYIPSTVSIHQAKDTGMAMVLICLLVSFFGHKTQFLGIAILLLLVNMTWPNFYKPVAKVWLGFSLLLGTVMSKILLSIVFMVLVVPVGILRRALGKDSLHLKKWKTDSKSVFKVREAEIKPEDIHSPY
jgi:hypothetical protein